MNIIHGNRNRVLANPPPRGEQIWSATTTDTSFVVPVGVTKVTAVVVGGGGYRSGSSSTNLQAQPGGNLRYIKTLSVTAGETLLITVGNTTTTYGSVSYIKRSTTILLSNTSTRDANIGGGNGGAAGGIGPSHFAVYGTINNSGGGGGAGGYSGNGGNGVNGFTTGNAGSGGGGGGGGGSNHWHESLIGEEPNRFQATVAGGGGGGVGIFGEGSSGAGGAGSNNYLGPQAGRGGSGGSTGGYNSGTGSSDGGNFGGGGCGAWNYAHESQGYRVTDTGKGGGGAVRIVWGSGREFPSTDVEFTV